MRCILTYRVRVCVRVYATLVDQWKTAGDKSAIFSSSGMPHKKPSNDIFGKVAAHDLDLLLEGQRFELRQFW